MSATFANITATLGSGFAQPFLVVNPATNQPFTTTQNTGATYAVTVTNGSVTVIPATSWTTSNINTTTGAVTMNITAAALGAASVAVYDYTFVVTLSDGTVTEQAFGKFIVNSQTASNISTPNTSWTYNSIPGIGELTLYAFYLCGISPTALTQEHMVTARLAAQLMLGTWNSVVNLWTIDLLQIPVGEGFASYSLPANTVAVLDVYITNSAGQNRILSPIGRTEFASIPNPAQTGRPTVFWFDRLLSPSINFWSVPDGTEPTLNIYRIRQIQDANLAGDKNAEMPIYFLEAFALGLAERLAMIWNPEKVAILQPLAAQAFQLAASQNVEDVKYYISPMISGYYRP